jgi:hypothetical protein
MRTAGPRGFYKMKGKKGTAWKPVGDRSVTKYFANANPIPHDGFVKKRFRVCDLNQPFLLPPSLQDWLPEDHLPGL